MFDEMSDGAEQVWDCRHCLFCVHSMTAAFVYVHGIIAGLRLCIKVTGDIFMTERINEGVVTQYDDEDNKD